ncbi:serine/threonine-protein kinase ULK1-like, partial [Tachysurus ichikawai]
EISGCVYLVMEYCNGGDLAEYLHVTHVQSASNRMVSENLLASEVHHEMVPQCSDLPLEMIG